MKTVQVSYTVKQEFHKKNQQNINAFLDEVRRIGDPDMKYYVFLGEDSKTFSHLSIYKNDEAQKRFLALPAFQAFQRERDASGLEKEPAISSFVLIDSSENPFK